METAQQNPTAPKPNKIEQLEKRIADQKARLAKLEFERRKAEAAASKKERAKETRRKILLGSMLLQQIESDESLRASVMRQLDAYLTRDDDRALFDLAPAASETLQ